MSDNECLVFPQGSVLGQFRFMRWQEPEVLLVVGMNEKREVLIWPPWNSTLLIQEVNNTSPFGLNQIYQIEENFLLNLFTYCLFIVITNAVLIIKVSRGRYTKSLSLVQFLLLFR